MKLNPLGELAFLQEFVDEKGHVFQRVQKRGSFRPEWRLVQGIQTTAVDDSFDELEISYKELLKKVNS